MKERGAERGDDQRIGVEDEGIELLHEFEMSADKIFGRVGGVVAFNGSELFGAFGVAIEFV